MSCPIFHGFVPGLLVGYALGVASMCGLVGLYLLHRPRYVAPTMHNRKQRGNPAPEPVEIDEQRADMGGVDYKWLGMTGSEQE
jgi:hypothetical protein